jgi:beta-phosphoglucomutase-like phosphatase (HAD superfamily)
MTRIAAICTDGDGTLWDSEEMLFRIFIQMLADRGHVFTLEDYRSVVGQSTEHATEIMFKRFCLNERSEDFIAERRARSIEILPQVRSMPGARAFLEMGVRAGLPIALVSSALTPHVSALLDLLDFRHYFTKIIVGDTPELQGCLKPHPKPYLLAARLLDVNPTRCLAVEDTHHGAMSAWRAGMIVVAAPHRFSPRENFPPTLAHHVLPEGKTLGDFNLAQVEHLLPF